MPYAVHAKRFALVLSAVLVLAACSQKAVDAQVDAEGAAADRGIDQSGQTSSSAGLPRGRIEVGEKLSMAKGKATGQSCVDCHGAEGNAPIDASYPLLGGQYTSYLAHALKAYRSGDRQHALMTAQASNLSDQDISDLASYFSTRPTKLRDLHGLE
jgi:cytochrome c553